jgi:hypothetical protein
MRNTHFRCLLVSVLAPLRSETPAGALHIAAVSGAEGRSRRGEERRRAILPTKPECATKQDGCPGCISRNWWGGWPGWPSYGWDRTGSRREAGGHGATPASRLRRDGEHKSGAGDWNPANKAGMCNKTKTGHLDVSLGIGGACGGFAGLRLGQNQGIRGWTGGHWAVPGGASSHAFEGRGFSTWTIGFPIDDCPAPTISLCNRQSQIGNRPPFNLLDPSLV